MAGMPEDKLPEVIVAEEGAPTTYNDPELARRIRNALEQKLNKTVQPFVQTDMGAEDFPMLVRVDPPIPSLYFVVGGTPQERFDIAAQGGPPVAGHHSGLFKIEPESSVKAGVEAMTIAALELLAKP